MRRTSRKARLGKLEKKILLYLLEKERRNKRRRAALTPEVMRTAKPGAELVFLEFIKTPQLCSEVLDDFEEELKFYLVKGRTPVRKGVWTYKQREHNIHRSLMRLLEASLLSLRFVTFRGKDRPGYWLTDRGRGVAEALLMGEKLKEIEKKIEELTRDGRNVARDALLALKEQRAKEGVLPFATQEQVREALWQVSTDVFESRELFDRFWTKRRLGRELKSAGCMSFTKRLDAKVVRVYDLTGATGFSPGEMLKKALAYIRTVERLAHAESGHIQEALWELYGKYYQNQEQFNRFWTKKRIGALMHKLGFKQMRRYDSYHKTLYWTYEIRSVPPDSYYDYPS
jgi:hypothetical protein